MGALVWGSLTLRPDSIPGEATAGGRTAEFPTPGSEAAEQPISSAPPVAQTNGAYRFLAAQDDGSTPVAYDPCRPIHYVIREQGGPPLGTQLITSAIESISAATGLRFYTTAPLPRHRPPQREPYQPDHYGDRWSPVLISWVTPEESLELAGNVAGMAGSVHLRVAGTPSVCVTGSVELDAPQLSDHMYRAGGGLLERAVIQHELGHLLGLDHVDDAGQLIYSETRGGVTGFGSGDLNGLAALGGGACVPQL